MIRILVFFLILRIFLFNSLFAANGTVIANGDWTDAATFLFSGVNRVPNCGDTVTIPSGLTATVNSQFNYTSCSSIIDIVINGTLSFTNGNKIYLPCNSTVTINTGGIVQKATAGGGSSTLISICNIVIWKAGDGTLIGPLILNETTPLPVNLISFNAVNFDKSIKISWTTESEYNSDYFMLERSVDAKTFSNISIVKSFGSNNTLNNYSVTDFNLSDPVIYYQLTQVDFNGLKHIYPVIFIKPSNDGSNLYIYASSANQVKVINYGRANKNCRLSIFNLSGRKVYECKNISLNQGPNIIELKSNQFIPDLYFINLDCGPDVYTQKLLFH